MQRIEATYVCKMHGFFSFTMINEPPRYMSCPTCGTGCDLTSCVFEGMISPDGIDDMNQVLAKIREHMSKAGIKVPITSPRVSGATAGGGSQEANNNPDIPITPAVEQSVFKLHEIKERAKMQALIDSIGA